MKLLHCSKCGDLRRVHEDGVTTCDCGESRAWHDEDHPPWVVVEGDHAHKIYVDNREISNAIFLTRDEPGRLYATFDWRTHPGWKGGSWPRAEDVWEAEGTREESARAFGYRAHRTATCEACGKRLPGEDDPAIVWGHSLDGLSYSAYCEGCAKRLRVKVVERITPEPEPIEAESATDDDDAGPAVLVPLPAARTGGDVSLEQTLASRRSVRAFSASPLMLNQLAQLLWSSQGAADGTDGLRTAPSAGALYPIEIYVAAGRVDGLDCGTYRYVTASHSLRRVHAGDVRDELCEVALSQTAVRDAPATVVVAASFARTTTKYGERGRRYVHMGSGHAAQNLCLQATAFGLGSLLIGAFDDLAVKTTLRLRHDEEPLYLVPVGVPVSG